MLQWFLFGFLAIQTSVMALSLDEIKDLAIKNSDILNAQEFETRALKSEALGKGYWQNPQFMGQFGTLKSGPYKGNTAEVSFTQAVPLSDKFSLRRDLTNLAVAQQSEKTLYYRNWVAHQALLSAWRVYSQRELFKHGKERERRLSLIKLYLDTRPKVSAKQRVEANLISTALVQMAISLEQKKYDLQVAISDLEFWIGKKITPEEIKFRIPEKILEAPSEINLNQDIELKDAKTQFKTSSLDLELARKERRPDLFLGGGYRVENVTPVNTFSYVIVGLNIPLWDTGSSRLEAANARKFRDEKKLNHLQRQIELKHKHQIETLRFGIGLVKKFPTSMINKSESSLHEAESAFKQGLLDVNTFMQTENQVHEVMDQVYLSWITYLEALSGLQLMRGEDLAWN